MAQTKAQLISNVVGVITGVNFSNLSLTGVTTVAAGSTSAPSISPTGDSNTGIFFPSPDTIAFAEGGVEAARFNSSGQLGIGTVTPGYKLHIHSGDMQFTNSTTGVAGNNGIRFYIDSSESDTFNIRNYRNSDLKIYTNNIERVRVAAGGNVGIGTTVPNDILHLEKNGDLYLRVRNSSTNINAYLGQDSNGTYIGNTGSSVVRFIQGASERMRINVSGYVGIGTTNPTSARLDVREDVNYPIRWGSTSTQFGELSYETGNCVIGATSGNKLTLRSAGTAAITIDTSQRVLVGATSARTIEPYGLGTDGQIANTYESVGDTNPGPGIALCSNSATDRMGPYLYFCRSKTATVGSNTLVSSGDNLGTISFAGADGTDVRNRGAAIYCEVDGTPGADDMPGRLIFSTTLDGAAVPTERMRITNAGKVLIGNNNLTGKFSVQETGAVSTPVLYGYASSTSYAGELVSSQSGTAAGTGWELYAGYASVSTKVYRVYGNGNVQNTNGSYTAISDAKLKENIVDAGSQWDDLKAIQIRNWNFKEETGYETHRQIGPIAQELEQVCPGLVFETPDRDADGNETGEVTKGVNQSVLYMKAVKALQEAMERIEQLEASNADLLARVTALEAS